MFPRLGLGWALGRLRIDSEPQNIDCEQNMLSMKKSAEYKKHAKYWKMRQVWKNTQAWKNE